MAADLPPPPPGRLGWPWTTETDPGCYTHRSDWPRISIVTPSLNQGAFIEETIRSVLLQNYPNLQYIVIDGGSTDGTVQILEKYSPWIDCRVSERDRGQSHAINKGLARCDGEWFNWINSDDYLLPAALAAVGRAAQASPEAQLIAGHLQVITADGTPQGRYTVKLTGRLTDDIVNHRTAQPAMFYRRDAVPSIDESLHYAMDFHLWTRLLSERGEAAVHRVGESVAAFRLHPHSKTGSQPAKFESEERVVLRPLAAALGSSSSFLDALAAKTAAGAPGARVALGSIERGELERELVRRYLLGDMTRRIWAQGFARCLPLFGVCVRVLPLATVVAAFKTSIKRRLRGSADV